MSRDLASHHRTKVSATLFGCKLIAVGLTVLPLLAGTAKADIVTGYFSAVVGDIEASNFLDASAFNYNTGDAVVGIFTYNTSNFTSTFTATLTDTNTSQTFTMPVGKVTSGSVTPGLTTYNLTATDSLISDPGQEDQTAFTTTLSLALTGSQPLLSGTGSFAVNIPQEGPYPAESAIFALDDVATAIPEPVSMAVFGVGVAGLLAARRRSEA